MIVIKAMIRRRLLRPQIAHNNQQRQHNLNVDANGEPIVEADNFRVGFTSKKLLSYFNISSFPIFHIDNTYSVNKYRYPLLAFGRSDYSGQFFPIAMAILAKEKGVDFTWFFLSLKKFCFYNFGLDLEKYVSWILTDACDAEYNAVTYNNVETSERCFPFASVLMCWFHVEFNVNKKINSKKVPETLEAMVKSDIKSLHYTLSEGEYTSQLL
jgi:hypothetical protein